MKREIVTANIEYEKDSPISLANGIINYLFDEYSENYEAYMKSLDLVTEILTAVLKANYSYPSDTNEWPI